MLGLDVSGSMGSGEIAGVPGLTPREAEAAMVMAYLKSEWGTQGNISFPMYHTLAFDNGLTPLALDPTMSLRSVCEKLGNWRGGATDCSLLMQYALNSKIPVDTFIIYTDNETYAGKIHPSKALDQYRNKMGIAARLIVVGFTSTGFSIARQNDPLMLDVVGFDSATPGSISGFVRGEI